MGRPLKKALFGNGNGSIKCRVKIGANAEADGYIIRQRGSKRFLVTDGTHTGICTLATGTLVADQMSISVTDDQGNAIKVAKLHRNVAIFADGSRAPWTFTASASDGKDQIADISDLAIGASPSNVSVTHPAAATFTASATGTGTKTYQWQVSINGGTSWANVVEGSPYSGSTTATLTINPTDTGKTTFKYRCVISIGNDSVTSAPATLTVS